MYLCYLLTVFLLFSVTDQTNDVLSFHRGRKLLSECIEDYLSNKNDQYNVDNEKEKVVADYAAQRFYGRTETVQRFHRRLYQLINDFDRKYDRLFKNNTMPRPLKWLIKEALIYCTDGQSNQTQAVPSFENEPPELAKVLDYILVDWPLPLQNIIGSTYGRALLRRYAENAQPALSRAMSYVLNRNYFRVSIRELWMRRAQIYFDGRDTGSPYIQHRYSISRGLYVQGDIQNMSWSRRGQNFSDRNPQIPQSLVTEFIKIHDADRPPHVEKNIFVEYEQNGMSSAEYYIETRIDQFYLTLLYIRKLQLSGISSDDEDTFNGFVPYLILDKKFQQMLYHNVIYRKILLEARKHLRNIYENSTKEDRNQIKSEECLLVTWMLSMKNDSNFSKPTVNDNKIYEHNKYHIKLNPKPVPVFPNELRILANILDLILVDWPTPLYHMICSREGRKTLRRYANEALLFLECALIDFADHEYLRYLLRSYWMFRAQYYFDGFNRQVPYLRHLYTLENPLPHTYDNLDQLFSRNQYHLLDRNPWMSLEYFIALMYIHAPDRPGTAGYDPFSVYEENGCIRSTDYYIEAHIDQFYRIIFFFMELRTHGISSDEEDIYNGTLPYDVMPFELQEIVHNNQAYRHYLLSLRTLLESSMINSGRFQNEISQSLSRGRINEEDLISLMRLWLIDSDSSHTVTGITTTTSTMRTTPIHGQKRKGSIWMNNKGKHFCNWPRTNVTQQSSQNNERYGFIIYYGTSSDQQNSTSEELLSALKIQDTILQQSNY